MSSNFKVKPDDNNNDQPNTFPTAIVIDSQKPDEDNKDQTPKDLAQSDNFNFSKKDLNTFLYKKLRKIIIIFALLTTILIVVSVIISVVLSIVLSSSKIAYKF